MKTCSKCSTPKADGEMTKNKATRDGLGAWCKVCHREYARKRRAEDPSLVERDRRSALTYRHEHIHEVRAQGRLFTRNRQKIVDTLKAQPCGDCGESFPSCCMDFDHTSEKLRGVGQMLSYRPAKLLAEINKCDLVCACCHRIRTQDRRKKTQNVRRVAYYVKIDALKKSPCLDCGKVYPPQAMDFDHVRGEKVLSIAQMRAAAWGRVLLELAKCDLVCANCHRIRTRARIPKAQEHAVAEPAVSV